MSRAIRNVLGDGFFFESPRWGHDSWFISDIYGRCITRMWPDGSSANFLELSDGRPSGLGWFPDGALGVVVNNRRRVLRVTLDGHVTLHADLSEQFGSHGNFNDMVIDAHGRAYVSNLGEGNVDMQRIDPPVPTTLSVIEPDGAWHSDADDLLKPNGMVITPDGATLIVGQTARCRYTAFAIGPDGCLGEPVLWADLAEHEICPDGCCLDSEGAIWVASSRRRTGWFRVARGGEVLEVIPAPAGASSTACMLGGEDGRDLLLCGRYIDEQGRHAADVRNGFVLQARVDVARAGLP